MIYWLPVFIWAFVIFLFSTGIGAGANTSRILGPLLQFLFPALSPETVSAVIFAIRKSAHAVEYAVLAILLWRGIVKPHGYLRLWDWGDARRAFLLAALYACTDELHQVFVASRVGHYGDVLLDSFGAVCGIALIWVWWRFRGFDEQLQDRP